MCLRVETLARPVVGRCGLYWTASVKLRRWHSISLRRVLAEFVRRFSMVSRISAASISPVHASVQVAFRSPNRRASAVPDSSPYGKYQPQVRTFNVGRRGAGNFAAGRPQRRHPIGDQPIASTSCRQEITVAAAAAFRLSAAADRSGFTRRRPRCRTKRDKSRRHPAACRSARCGFQFRAGCSDIKRREIPI